jgi:ribosomal-protein-alanine N-acetyltransferase
MDEASLFSTFPTLTTPRLILRELVLADVDRYHRIHAKGQDNATWQTRLDGALDDTRARIAGIATTFAAHAGIRWGIALAAGGELAGSAGFWRWVKPHFRAEIGYELAPEHRGSGYMAEALSAILRFGFETMDLHSVEANTHPQNHASIAVLERLGFRREGTLRESFLFDGRFHDTAVFSLLRPWLAPRRSAL